MLGDFGGLKFLLSGFSDFIAGEAALLIAVAAASIISLLEIGVSLPCVLQSSEVRDSSIEQSSSVACCSPVPFDASSSSESIPPSWVSEIVFIVLL